MNTKFIAARLIDAAKEAGRRFRNILANSGDIMESGEVRDLNSLFVMDHSGKLIKVSDLATDPEEQSENYSVKAQADHGTVIDGELVPSIEKQFGSCRVWLEKDGLHARMYFASEDTLADHAWAISQDASYSTGIDWFPNGYYGTGYEIDQPIGILREISMVLTGNDPRAHTIDNLPTEEQTQGNEGSAENSEVEVVNNIKQIEEENDMVKTNDELTSEERDGILAEMAEVLNKFTKQEEKPEVEEEVVVEEETTDEIATDGEEIKEEIKGEEEEVEETKDTLKSPVVVVKDSAKQEIAVKSTDWLKTDASVAAWGKALIDAKGDKEAFKANFKAAALRDGINLGEDVEIAPEAVINAVAEQLNDAGSIFNMVNKTGLAFEVVATPTEGAAKGHVRGRNKVEENVELNKRVFTPADLYKLMKLDHSMVKLNGGLSSSAIVKYVLNELPRKLVEAIDQAILVGGITNDDEDQTAFTALTSVVSDIADTSNVYAVEYQALAGDNMRATISKAAAEIKSGSNRVLITTQNKFTDIENAVSGTNLIFPNGINKEQPNINGIARVMTPLWLTDAMLAGYEAIIVDLSAYDTVGDSTPESFSDYDIDVNKYVYEAVACIGGGLAKGKSAVGIKAAA